MFEVHTILSYLRRALMPDRIHTSLNEHKTDGTQQRDSIFVNQIYLFCQNMCFEY